MSESGGLDFQFKPNIYSNTNFKLFLIEEIQIVQIKNKGEMISFAVSLTRQLRNTTPSITKIVCTNKTKQAGKF
jgi:hypothetical protein